MRGGQNARGGDRTKGGAMTFAMADEKVVAESLPVDALVTIYEQAEKDIRAGFAQIAGALDAIDASFVLGGHSTNLRTGSRRHHEGFNFGDPSDAIRELRRDCWDTLVERTQIRRIMSIKAWETFSRELQDGEPPPITVETVNGMLAGLQADIPDMLKAAVDEVFEFLRPHHSQFKTNTEYALGERVVLNYYVERGFGKTWHVNYTRQQNLLALENVFRMLDGKVQSERAGHYSDLESAIRTCPEGGPCAGQTEYFEFKGHKKQTLHLRFRRMDLVKKLNAMAGGKRLTP
jgi:hypothetical protein